MKLQVLLLIVWVSELYCQDYTLQKKFSWSQLEFQFPSEAAKNEALATNSYIPDSNVIWSLGVWKDKVFVALFRQNFGVVSSFNYFSINAERSPVLIPYPSYYENYVPNGIKERPPYTMPSQSSIICAAYFRIDYKCDRLWIMDTAIDDFLGAAQLLAPPALVIFDLNTNQLIRRYTIPAKYVNSMSAFVYLEIDINGKCCDDVFAYMADMVNHVIVVYSYKKNRSWRLSHKSFGSEPGDGNFVFGGLRFQWNFGIVGITVGERYNDGSRRVYLKPFSSSKTYYISNKVLQNEAYIKLNRYSNDIYFLGDRGDNSNIFHYVYDEKTNVLFDNSFIRQRIECWNAANPFRNSTFGVVFSANEEFFSTDLTIDRNRNLWVLSNNFPAFQYGYWNENNGNNIVIYKGKIDKLISGTVCKK